MLINNKYKIEQELGRGGMGTVYRAFDIDTNTLVAVKETIILPSEGEQRKLKRLQREYQFLKNIQHPNIVRAIDFFEYQNTHYIVMEYVDGHSLESVVQEKPYSLTVEQQLEIAMQICDAIATLNEKGVVHRDLKPANIIVCKYRGIPKVLDLGIAKDVQKSMTMLTRPGYVIGTFAYMSPEQFNAEASSKSDTFSLGVMFYQFFLWLPKSPYHATNINEALEKINNMQLPPLALQTKNPHALHASISEILDKALLHDIDKRLSVREMHRCFAALLGREVKTSAPKQNPKTNRVNRSKVTSRSRRLDVAKKRHTGKQQKSSNINSLLLKIRSRFHTPQTYIRIGYIVVILILAYFVSDHYVKSEPKDYFRMGQAALSAKKYHKAIRFYSLALQQDPQNAIAYLGKGKAYFECQDYKSALSYFSKSIAIKKTSEVLFQRGSTYRKMAQYEKAIDDFRQAINLDKRNVGAYYALGFIFEEKKKYQEAVDICTKGIEVFPKNFHFWINRGFYLSRLDKDTQALEAYLKAIALRENDVLGYRNCAATYNSLKQYSKALSYITKAIELDKDSTILREIRMEAAEKLDNTEVLLEDYAYLLQVAPTVDLYKRRGYLYFRLEKYKSSIEDYSKGIALRPLSYSLYLGRALSYDGDKQYKKAIKDYQQVVKLSPENYFVYAYISRSYTALGNSSKASLYQRLYERKRKK
ncbi:serine/threonine-protein kinase [Candidatus Uabimicrobium amorphum]|uniref:Serine/threonine protein kinase n=1 Tax=Uabimicrobium amorphum TaxID=2596890 RepID=A0A5S9IVK4_UABAM|nr:serine/threonine-protein kinase [Candidatus Uabimicrobium amorphum]BBM88311.1 serine/threonine protein kinase [Candidatus Uabimicrobium amorphum]